MFTRAILILVLSVLPLQSAWADWDRGNRGDRGHQERNEFHGHSEHRDAHRDFQRRGHSNISFNFWSGPVFAYRPYHPYYPRRVFYAPPPVEREVIYLNTQSEQHIEAEQNIDNRYCREYQSVSTIGGIRRQTYGTACMQPDGSWEIIS